MRADVAKLLVEASAIEMVSESGTAIEVWTISAEGPLVRASAPRLAVAEGMALGCRLVVDGMPHRVRVVVEEASVQSEKRAALHCWSPRWWRTAAGGPASGSSSRPRRT
jgi:hypothetical protein